MRNERHLSLVEREEISRGLAAGLSVRVIAERLGRAPSTLCREVNANGGRQRYRALVADRAARRRARRPSRRPAGERSGRYSLIVARLLRVSLEVQLDQIADARQCLLIPGN